MTVSNVHTFDLTRDELITEALELTASIDIGSSIPAEILASCARSLNLYIKAWQTRGLFLHTYQPASLALVVDQAAYLLGPTGTAVEFGTATPIIRPLKITDVRLSGDDNEPPLTELSLYEYMALTTKDVSSRPSQFAYDPQLGNGKLHLWPAPESATEYSLLFNYKKPVDDFTMDSDTAAIPANWLQALTLGLAYTIAPKRQVPLNEQVALKKRYEEAMDNIDDFEGVSFFIEPR